MFKSLIPLAAAAGMAVICACAPEKIEPKTALVSANPSAPPMSWIEDGDLKGTGPDCAKIAIKSLDIVPSFRTEGDWTQILEKARNGEIDFVTSLFKTKEREEYLDFSIPYLSVPVVVMVKNGGKFPFSRWSDLKGKKGMIGTGESYGEDFDKFAEKELAVARAPIKDCLKTVAAGGADYVVANLKSGLISAYEAGLVESIECLEIPVSVQDYRMAISKKSKYRYCMEGLNLKLTEMKVDGTPERLTAKYLILWRNRYIQHLSPGSDLQVP